MKTIDKEIDPIFDHFVAVPKQSTANPQDIPFFLSTRILVDSDVRVSPDTTTESKTLEKGGDLSLSKLYRIRGLDSSSIQEQSGKEGQVLLSHVNRMEEIANQVILDFESRMERFGS